MPKSLGGAQGCLLGHGLKLESKARPRFKLVAELWFEYGSGSLTPADHFVLFVQPFACCSPY